MGIRSRLRAKYSEAPSYEDVQVHPPGSPPAEGHVRQAALPHINWNQFGPKGTEHNWTDIPILSAEDRAYRESLGR